MSGPEVAIAAFSVGFTLVLAVYGAWLVVTGFVRRHAARRSLLKLLDEMEQWQSNGGAA